MAFGDLFSTRIFTISNLLSLFRIAVSPLLCFWVARSVHEAAYTYYSLYLVIAIVASDFLDGFLARLLGQETPLGQYLDPIADKVSIITGLILLYLYKGLPLWLIIFIVVREILSTWLGIFLLARRNVMGKPNYWGKWGVTTVAFCGVIYLLDLPYKELSMIPVVFTYVGGIIAYGVTYWPTIFQKK